MQTNMFLGALETAFDNWFHTQYPGLTPDNPQYQMYYQEEVARFAEYLVNDFVGDWFPEDGPR